MLRIGQGVAFGDQVVDVPFQIGTLPPATPGDSQGLRKEIISDPDEIRQS